MGHTRTYSEEVAAIIDEEIKQIVDTAYATAIKLLKDNKQILHGLSKALLEKETLREEEYMALFNELKDMDYVEPPVELLRALNMEQEREEVLGMEETEEKLEKSDEIFEKVEDRLGEAKEDEDEEN